MPIIRVDNEVYSWLKSQAEPFEDTPNTVLRRLAGLNKRSLLASSELVKGDNKSKKIEQKGAMPMNIVLPKKPGKYLARLWNVNVVHALYHKDGTYYHHLRDFPGALFNPNGYVIFKNEKEYYNSSYLQHGQELHVPNGIYSMPGYIRKR